MHCNPSNCGQDDEEHNQDNWISDHPDRCRSSSSPSNRQNCVTYNLGRDVPRASGDCKRSDSDNSLQGYVEENSGYYPGDDGGDFWQSDSNDISSGS